MHHFHGFGMHVIYDEFVRLMVTIYVWHFIFLHYIYHLEQNSYHMSLETPLDFTTICHYKNVLSMFLL
jgi:hypothetical protein